MNLIAGMLADRFHCYNLILIVIVGLVAVSTRPCCTLTLAFRPRSSSRRDWISKLPPKSSAAAWAPSCAPRTTRATPAAASTAITGNVDAVAVPADGLPWSAGTWMQLCLSDGNCTQIATGSTSVLEMDALLEVLNVTP